MEIGAHRVIGCWSPLEVREFVLHDIPDDRMIHGVISVNQPITKCDDLRGMGASSCINDLLGAVDRPDKERVFE